MVDDATEAEMELWMTIARGGRKAHRVFDRLVSMEML